MGNNYVGCHNILSQVSIVSFLGTLLTSIQGWLFFKIPTTGQMTSQNIKDTCEKIGYSITCQCSYGGNCPYGNGNNCVKTFKHWQDAYLFSSNTLSGISSKLCPENSNPTYWWKCEPMNGICEYLKTGNIECSDEAGSKFDVMNSPNKWSPCAFKP